MFFKEYEIRPIKLEEGEAIVRIEHTCFSPDVAETREALLERVHTAPELFFVAVNRDTNEVVAYLNGVSTNEDRFKDEFFLDINMYDKEGLNIMLLGLAVLPDHRGKGLAKAIMEAYKDWQRKAGKKNLYLTCQDGKVEMYKKMNFINLGTSASSWGGKEWHEMVCEL